MTGKIRRIVYLSGTRADFGLMLTTLQAIHSSPALELKVVVTGMHLSERFGMTVREIEAAGLSVAARVPVNIDEATGAAMARNLAQTLSGCVDAFQSLMPDVVVLLGDRGEMLAGALAAIHLGIAIVHIHGGERSGSVDEPVRHAISKLAHFHFTSTDGARQRLIRMGERDDRIWVVGAPGLDNLNKLTVASRSALLTSLNIDPRRPVGLLVHHPVVQDSNLMALEVQNILDGLFHSGCQIVALMPNSDSGAEPIRDAMLRADCHPDFRLATHFSRETFVSLMSVVDFMIGNSSAGIIEAASFGTPVINIGSRQNLRERNHNITDVAHADEHLPDIISSVLKRGRLDRGNIYGDGESAARITALLSSVPISPETLRKFNAY